MSDNKKLDALTGQAVAVTSVAVAFAADASAATASSATAVELAAAASSTALAAAASVELAAPDPATAASISSAVASGTRRFSVKMQPTGSSAVLERRQHQQPTRQRGSTIRTRKYCPWLSGRRSGQERTFRTSEHLEGLLQPTRFAGRGQERLPCWWRLPRH